MPRARPSRRKTRPVVTPITDAMLAVVDSFALILPLCLQEDELEDESPFDLTPEERAARIAALEREIEAQRKHVEELNGLGAEAELTAKAAEAQLREMEVELATLRAVDAIVRWRGQQISREEWRRLISESIRRGQNAALLILLIELLAPIVAAYGIIGLRALLQFLLGGVRQGPIPMPAGRYASVFLRLFNRLREGLRKYQETGQERGFWEALRKLEEFRRKYHPVG